MNTDIRIDWHSGMEITPQTFIDMENDISENRMLLRKILAAKSFGIIPRTKFSIEYDLVGYVLKVKQIDCSLLLPTGQVVVLESGGGFDVEIPNKEVNEMYLNVEVGDKITNFIKAGIPHVANEYKFEFKALSEIKSGVPLLKIVNEGGDWKMYKRYMMPVISVRTSVPLIEKYEEVKKCVRSIVEHECIDFLDGRVMVQVLADQLISFSIDDSSRELMLMCKRFMSALAYSIYKKKPEMPIPNVNDIEPYLDFFMSFVNDAAVAMKDLKPKEEEKKEIIEEDLFMPRI